MSVLEDQWLHFKRGRKKSTGLCSLTFSSEKNTKTLKYSEGFLSFQMQLSLGVKSFFLLCLGHCWRNRLPVSVISPHTACEVARSLPAAYWTNLCKARVNNLYQAWGDKLNTPILSKMLWTHQDGGRMQGKGTSGWGPKSVQERGHCCKENEM